MREAGNILIITHDRPDGDAISSAGAMAELSQTLNKQHSIFCQDPAPSGYNFIPHSETFITDRTQLDFSGFDLIIVLDCGSLSRTKLAEEISGRNQDQFIIELDHHPLQDSYAQIEIKDTGASATCEIVYDFFQANKIIINKDMATCILTGILTDTGNFLYPSTTQRAMDIAGEMMVLGAQYPRIIDWTWRNKSLPAMKLWGKALSGLEINLKYNFAFAILTESDLAASAVSDAEMEGMAGFLSNLYGVKGIVLLRQEGKNKIKGSLRSALGGADVSRLARALGGGGHPRASGFVINGNLAQENGIWKII